MATPPPLFPGLKKRCAKIILFYGGVGKFVFFPLGLSEIPFENGQFVENLVETLVIGKIGTSLCPVFWFLRISPALRKSQKNIGGLRKWGEQP